MKKFLFTLAALLMAGSLCADEYFYIDNFEVAESQLGKNITVVVKAHFDHCVQAGQVDLTLPEGFTLTKITKGADFTDFTYFDEYGEEWNDEEQIFRSSVATTNFAFALSTQGYYEVDGEWLSYGAVAFVPGDYEEMAKLTIKVADNFAGGNIIVESQPSCGENARTDLNDPCPKGQDNFHTCIVTVEGGQQLQDLTGIIELSEVTEDGHVAISYTGTEDVTITVNGVEYTEPIQLVEGTNELTVVVSAEGYNDLTGNYTIIWTPVPPTPEVTATPTFDWNPETFTITAIGAGEVLMYVNGEPVSNPYTFEQTDVEMTYTVTATAQEPGKEISEIATMTVTVPAKEVTPVDPDDHNVGYWLVTLDKNNEPVWTKLQEGQNGYTKAVELQYEVYGRYNHDTGYRGNVPFYFMIDGVRYGADEFEAATVIGDAMENPLSEADGYYTVEVGYYYTLGVFIDLEGNKFVYCSRGSYTGVDELMNGKTVASTRYFNMAGQEMTEANGMTIVVTTYTDGTTSAVKVMK
jgi:hypothetical protein